MVMVLPARLFVGQSDLVLKRRTSNLEFWPLIIARYGWGGLDWASHNSQSSPAQSV